MTSIDLHKYWSDAWENTLEDDCEFIENNIRYFNFQSLCETIQNKDQQPIKIKKPKILTLGIISKDDGFSILMSVSLQELIAICLILFWSALNL